MMDDRALFQILKCAEGSGGQIGRSGMLKLLLGRDSRKVWKLKLDHMEEYGSLSFMGSGADSFGKQLFFSGYGS